MKIVDIYRSEKQEGMYLYVDHEADLQTLPEKLMSHFGKATFVMKLPLSEERKLAAADAKKVLFSIDEQGYYLQMPPLNLNKSVES